MKPEYERDGVRLYLGRCEDVLPTLDRASVDAVIADPPYGMKHPCNFGERGRSNLAQCNDYPDVEGDATPFDPSPLLALGKPTVLWGGNWFADRLPPRSGWLVWDKLRPDDLDQATCELAWTNFVKGVRRYTHLWNGMMRASEHGESYHPTQKPVALMSWVLRLPWTPRGLVLDPYMGSGTTGVAAVREGRRFIGIECERRYFDIAVRRIDAEIRQGRLFENGGAA